jgi:hypothetical protein
MSIMTTISLLQFERDSISLYSDIHVIFKFHLVTCFMSSKESDLISNYVRCVGSLWLEMVCYKKWLDNQRIVMFEFLVILKFFSNNTK